MPICERQHSYSFVNFGYSNVDPELVGGGVWTETTVHGEWKGVRAGEWKEGGHELMGFGLRQTP